MADADPPIRASTGPLQTIERIRDRAVEAVIGQSGVSHPGLAAEIRRRFGSSDVATGALVREPVIEGAAPFVSSGRTFAQCAGDPLHPDVIRAIASETAGDYRFPAEAEPYRHQLDAWRHLIGEERNSVLVSSGTGSGKTECFLMPLLSDLASEAEQTGRLSGVRAIALYPLNALIASQEERLRAWTAPFGDRVRFGLYNGLTPERLARTDKPVSEQVKDRATLRRDPPPILVTNVTMLEYMIVRRIDRPLIEKSRGQLRWIILDEAHSYIGSAAAEIALLLRRVLLTFGVTAEDVRFVATSATIGDGRDVTDELRHFLRDLSGADEARVKVVMGERQAVALPAPAAPRPWSQDIAVSPDQVKQHPVVQSFVRALERSPVRLDEARALLAPIAAPVDEVVEAVAGGGEPLLPLRIHGFLRAVPGLWSCLNPDCPDAPADWPFGAIAFERAEQCPCGSPVFEIKTCRECGEPYLECEEAEGRLRAVVTPATTDEFAALAEREPTEVPDDPEPAPDDDHDYEVRTLAIATRPLRRSFLHHVEPATGRRHDQLAEGRLPLSVHSPDHCGACDAQRNANSRAVLRPLRFGAPFLIGNAAPVLLDGTPKRDAPVESAHAPPAQGRQLLSFTDSRQGTARFAANLQTNAERGYVRGFLYHAVQGSMMSGVGDDPRIASLRDEIATLEPVATSVPAIGELLAAKRAELERLRLPSTDGIAWTAMRDRLAATPEIGHWMTRIWGQRDERYRNDPLALAEFLLLRELARRPRRANTAETLGLVRLRFDAIDRANAVPEALSARGFGVAEWQGLLHAIMDMVVRPNFAIRATAGDIHWLNPRTPQKLLLAPGEAPQGKRELRWPRALSQAGRPSNLVLILEKTLGLDRTDGAGRVRLNEVLDAAWQALLPLFASNTQPGYALDFGKARIAPVVSAWRCPVTQRVLPTTALGRTLYGHREGLRPSDEAPQPIDFPRLPTTFPRGDDDQIIAAWLRDDAAVQALRDVGLWANLHDRAAALSPYLRAAEHSAQQPPNRLRRFEGEFKRGEINILNCSTTMEMGVDIGSVSAVMMTNVPPALANYRQRVGRAGRRRQGFASSLTYTRDTPLDREAFRDPQTYLARQTRAPRVKLDSRRIVQRHVNALLLARWFAEAGGEAMRTRVGDFFGLPGDIGTARIVDAPVSTCIAWMTSQNTISALTGDVERLVRGTVLAGDRTLFIAAQDALKGAQDAVIAEWDAIQDQATGAPAEGKASLSFQLKRLVQDNLLRELGYRGVLPAHGFPMSVVPFVNDDEPSADERRDDEPDDASRRRRSFPTRTLDIAIRDYAPGAEVVVDGLVYRSAGVTLNWLRPAENANAREIQSLKTFWTCQACGAADCGHVAPLNCPACHAEVQLQRRFLEPAGFTVDMQDQPHADTDEVTYVEPELEQIVARGAAWLPMADPAQGRMRATADGLVFYSSRGPEPRLGYHICLECGRSAPAAAGPGEHPLKDHAPLRFTKRNADGYCPGNDKAFKVTQPIALGHETVTDVVEIQPIGLETEGAAWAAVSALREALSRRLGVETGELGMAVRPVVSTIGQRTHSLFLYDRASGGAGFAPQAASLFDELLVDVVAILDCEQPGCIRGCSACILTADLYRQAEIVDRRAALTWARAARAALGQVPEADRADAGAVLSRSMVDDIVAAVDRGARAVTLWLSEDSDVTGIGHGPIATLARRIADRSAAIALVVTPAWLASLDAAARMALRDAAIRLGMTIETGTARGFDNGATALAAVDDAAATLWASRDRSAGIAGLDWGQAADAPIVRLPGQRRPLGARIDLDTLLPPAHTRVFDFGQELDGTLSGFGERLAATLLPAIRAAGGTAPLQRMDYNDRYLQSPLVVRLLTEAASALRDSVAPGATLPIRIVTNRLKANERQPFAPGHDWQWEEDRRDVLLGLLQTRNFDGGLVENGAGHGRILTLTFADNAKVRVIFDHGFGPWRTPSFARWAHFGDSVPTQVAKIATYSVIVSASGSSYAVVTT